MPRLFFTPGVHGVMVGEILVLLDLRHDAYLCLPDAGGCAIRDDEIECDDAVADDLLADGLAGCVASPRLYKVRALPPGASDQSGEDDGASALRQADLTSLALVWLKLAPRRPTLLQLAQRVGRRPSRSADADILRHEAANFHAARPYFPWIGQCLFQSWWMLEHLQARGLDATWVFAVRAWPFAAHCWLQHGDLCLTDPPETLAAYRPILAI